MIPKSGNRFSEDFARVSLAREAHRQPADRFERIGKFGFVRLDERRRDDRAGNDDVTGAQLFTIGRERACHMYHYADHLTDELLDIVLACRERSTTEHVSVEAVELCASA